MSNQASIWSQLKHLNRELGLDLSVEWRKGQARLYDADGNGQRLAFSPWLPLSMMQDWLSAFSKGWSLGQERLRSELVKNPDWDDPSYDDDNTNLCSYCGVQYDRRYGFPSYCSERCERAANKKFHPDYVLEDARYRKHRKFRKNP